MGGHALEDAGCGIPACLATGGRRGEVPEAVLIEPIPFVNPAGGELKTVGMLIGPRFQGLGDEDAGAIAVREPGSDRLESEPQGRDLPVGQLELGGSTFG